MPAKEKSNKKLLWIFIVFGAIAGSYLGDTIGTNILPLSFMKKPYLIGSSAPFVLNLKVIVLTLGINLNFNIMTIIGVVLAIILHRKY